MSYELGDEFLEGVVSGCCGARVLEGERCSDCYEGCSLEDV